MMTFAMSYNESEYYILPLSHDEVVHLKCSMVEKMPGYKVDKYANLRAAYAFMFGHSGKKLLFMGQDFAQEREWSEKREIDWFLLDEPLNKGMHAFVGDLLKLYQKFPCLSKHDHESWEGFEWINADDRDRSIYSFVRKDAGQNELLFVINFTPVERPEYRVGVPREGKYIKLLDSGEEKYADRQSGKIRDTITAKQGLCDYREYSIEFDLPAYGAVVFGIPNEEREKDVKTKEKVKNAPKVGRTEKEKKRTVKNEVAELTSAKSGSETKKKGIYSEHVEPKSLIYRQNQAHLNETAEAGSKFKNQVTGRKSVKKLKTESAGKHRSA